MSLLEDVFLQDEAGEAQELERIIEGDEYDERAREEVNSDENSEKDDEAEEDKRRVDPSSTKAKRVVKNPRFVLNPARLTGPRGISVIPEHFKDFKFKGKGHEKEDLDLVLKKLEHWAYRLYPKFKFEDCLKKIETLGKKRPVAVHLHKIRSDQLITEDAVVQKDSSDEELAAPLPEEDEFDQLLQQQIELARATPGPGENRPGFSTPAVDKRSPLMMPKPTSSPSISDEQRERMLRNRKLAEERRLARLKAAENVNTVPTVDLTNGNIDRNETVTMADEDNNVTVNEETRARKNRSNVIDSSEDEEPTNYTNQDVIVDVHNTIDKNTIDLTEVPVLKNTPNNEIDLTEITEVQNRKNNSSDDNESMNQDADVVNVSNKKIIDLTEVPTLKNTTSNVIDFEITGVQNKNRNPINRFNDNESIIVDAHIEETSNEKIIDLTEVPKLKNTSNKEKTSIQSKANVSNRIEVDADNTGKDKFIDLTEGYQIQKSHNEKDLENLEFQNENKDDVDSSDDEDVSFVNQSIVVDVHNTSSHDKDEISSNKNTNYTDAKNEEKSIEDEITDRDSEKLNNVDMDSLSNDKQIEIVTGDDMGDDDNNMNKKSLEINDNQPQDHDLEMNNAVNHHAKNPSETNLDTNNDKVGNDTSKVDEVLDNLMDVDFSDDF